MCLHTQAHTQTQLLHNTAAEMHHVLTFVQVTLKGCDAFDLQVLKGPSDYVTAANSTESTEKIEACVKVWIKQIEQVSCVG